MSTYTISDIHGCYEEFMELIEQIKFDPASDTLYVLGDAIDRGDRPVDCLRYIQRTKSVYFLIGNHEQMMLDFYNDKNQRQWWHNGCESTMEQLATLSESERKKIFGYLHTRQFYQTLKLNDRRFFLSHAGLDVSLPFCRQPQEALVWSRQEFYGNKTKKHYICIFGHTPTFYLRSNRNCAIWLDTDYNDKICIDTGCVFGGALSALRLDDGATFYVKARSDRGGGFSEFNFNSDPVPESFFNTMQTLAKEKLKNMGIDDLECSWK